MSIGNNAVLSGSLAIELAPDAEVAFGDAFTLFDIGGFQIGAFDDTPEGQTLATHNGVDLVLTYTAGGGRDVALLTAIAGDLDGDGTTGAADLDIVLAHWGDEVTPNQRTAGDLNGDGLVGQHDLDLVIAHWGNTAPPETQIPEPGSLLLFAAAGACLSRRRRRYA
ncbi:dockerin type I domain-containing protein [Phycisphaeraceae bacterium D3-23]